MIPEPKLILSIFEFKNTLLIKKNKAETGENYHLITKISIDKLKTSSSSTSDECLGLKQQIE